MGGNLNEPQKKVLNSTYANDRLKARGFLLSLEFLLLIVTSYEGFSARMRYA